MDRTLLELNYSPAQSCTQYLTSYVKPSEPSDDPACPICYEAWNPDTCAIVKTMCGHTFHRLCLTQWLEGVNNEIRPNTCPCCRAVCFPKDSTTEASVQSEAHSANDPRDPRLWVGLDYASNDAFMIMTAHVQRIVGPLLELDEIYERFGIDMECSDDTSRFLRAMDQVVSTGVALSRSPSNLHQGRMLVLAPYLGDWLTVKFLVASLFITTQYPLMTPMQWTGVLAERDRIRRAASHSTDFGSSSAAWLEYINDRHRVQYEISVDDYFPDATLACWKENNSAGHVVNEGHRDCTSIDNSLRAYINASGTDMSLGPVLYFQGNSLCIYERVFGNVVEFSIDNTLSTVLVRTSADHTFKIEFLQRGI